MVNEQSQSAYIQYVLDKFCKWSVYKKKKKKKTFTVC